MDFLIAFLLMVGAFAIGIVGNLLRKGKNATIFIGKMPYAETIDWPVTRLRFGLNAFQM
jgi:hypothetical protein